MQDIKVLGIDLAKDVFQLHGVDARGKRVLKKRIERCKLPVSMANRIEPFLAINFEPLFQRKITYLALISVDSFPLPA